MTAAFLHDRLGVASPNSFTKRARKRKAAQLQQRRPGKDNLAPDGDLRQQDAFVRRSQGQFVLEREGCAHAHHTICNSVAWSPMPSLKEEENGGKKVK